jgi:hypothetical protein
LNPSAWARAVAINKVYFLKENAIYVPFKLHGHDYMAKGIALLDSEATHNFMDKRMARQLRIRTKPLVVPRTIRNVDGTHNQDGTLNRFSDLEVTVNSHKEILHFYIMDLAKDRAIFGFLWFQEFNPKINWKSRTIDTEVIFQTTNAKPPEWA